MAAINKLSDKFLRSIYGKPYNDKKLVSDGAGLAVRVSPRGTIAWVFRYRLGGRDSNPKWVSLGNYPETSLKQAREKRDLCRSWLDNGKDPKTELLLAQNERLKPVTVEDAIEYWLVEYASEHRKNIDKHRAQFKRHIYPYIGNLPLEKVETPLWLECFDRIRKGIPGKQRPARVSAGQVLQGTKQALIFCRKRRYAISHALDDINILDVGSKQQKRERFLTEAELTDVLQLIRSSKLLPYYDNLIWILIVFGARTQEVRLSTWDEWDFEKGVWTVPKANSKTAEKIVRPIPESMRSWLLELKARTLKSGYVLGELKRPEAVSQFGGGLWKRLKHDEKWTLHDFRRTLSTRLNDLGVQPHIVEHLLGHTVGGVAGIYNRSQYLVEKEKALEVWLYSLSNQSGCISSDGTLKHYGDLH